MTTVSISVDVPSLVKGVLFYENAFGFLKVSEPVPGVAMLSAGQIELCLLEKRAGSQPSPFTQDIRRYERHWTPVHLDFVVADVDVDMGFLDRAGQFGLGRLQF